MPRTEKVIGHLFIVDGKLGAWEMGASRTGIIEKSGQVGGMKGDIESRAFAIDDYEAAVELWKKVEGVEIAEGDDREGVAHFLARNPGLSRVALDGPKIVGVAFCGQDGRRGSIYHLAVDPNYRGRGLGKRLVDECLEGLRRLGLKRATIMVATDNPRGRRFWKRCGWEELEGAIGMGIDL